MVVRVHTNDANNKRNRLEENNNNNNKRRIQIVLVVFFLVGNSLRMLLSPTSYFNTTMTSSIVQPEQQDPAALWSLLPSVSTPKKNTISSSISRPFNGTATTTTTSSSHPTLSSSSLAAATAAAAILDQVHELTGGKALAQNKRPLQCPEYLVPFYDIVHPPNNNNNISLDSPIPKMLHVSMKSRCLPPEYHDNLYKSWQHALPGYSIFFHDDEAVKRLFSSYSDNDRKDDFPLLRPLLQHCIKPGAMTIDVWRVLVVYEFGGIYSDIDNTPNAETFQVDQFLHNVSAFFFQDLWQRPSQWFFAMTAKHPIAKYAMQAILEAVYAMEDVSRPKIVFTTGPGKFRDGYAKFLKGQPGIYGGEKGIKMLEGEVMPTNENTTITSWVRVMTGKTEGRNDYISIGGYGMGFARADNLKELPTEPHPFDPRKGNVTKRQRVELLTGVEHWTKTRFRPNSRGFNNTGPCRRYLMVNKTRPSQR